MSRGVCARVLDPCLPPPSLSPRMCVCLSAGPRAIKVRRRAKPLKPHGLQLWIVPCRRIPFSLSRTCVCVCVCVCVCTCVLRGQVNLVQRTLWMREISVCRATAQGFLLAGFSLCLQSMFSQRKLPFRKTCNKPGAQCKSLGIAIRVQQFFWISRKPRI